MRKFSFALVCLLLAACSDDPKATGPLADATSEDIATDSAAGDGLADGLSPSFDVGPDHVEPTDLSEDKTDPDDSAFSPDGGEDAAMDVTAPPTVPLPGFGAISGTCGFIDDELFDPAPSFEVNTIDFGDDPYDDDDFDRLTEFGRELIRDGNAGGSSLYSEVFAMEVLARCELATLIASETEIVYDIEGKITDILVAIDGYYVGVSVVRAVGFPKDAPYTVAQATTILQRKLSDILISTINVSPQDRWVKQILHILAYEEEHVSSMRSAWESISAEIKDNTIVIVTLTNGDDAFMY